MTLLSLLAGRTVVLKLIPMVNDRVNAIMDVEGRIVDTFMYYTPPQFLSN